MPLELHPTRRISTRAHSLRVLTRTFSFFAGLLALASLAAAKGWLPKELTGSLLLLLLAVLIAAAWSGLRAHRQALADRDRESGNAIFLAIAAQLGSQDDATLARIQSKGGPAGEAAKMILTERRARAARTGR
jgi:O-antigen/teichoic acid export membrane protein